MRNMIGGPNLKSCVKCKNILKPNLKEVLWFDFAHLEYDKDFKSYLINYGELVLLLALGNDN